MSISDKFRNLRGPNLFHYTHEENVEKIKASNSVIFSRNRLYGHLPQPTYITDEMSREIDERLGYHDYVFLVFSEDHPFIFKNKSNGIPLKRATIDVSILDMQGVKIADRVATDSAVVLYTPNDALQHLKIEHCHGDYIEDRSIWDEVKKYEILIPNQVDLKRYGKKGRR